MALIATEIFFGFWDPSIQNIAYQEAGNASPRSKVPWNVLTSEDEWKIDDVKGRPIESIVKRP